MTPPPVSPYPTTVLFTPHISTSKTKGNTTSKRFQDEIYAPNGAQSFIANLPVPTKSETDISFAYFADPNIDYYTGIIDCSDPRDFIAKTQSNPDPENTSYNEATAGTHA